MTECSDGEKYLKSLQQGDNRFPDSGVILLLLDF